MQLFQVMHCCILVTATIDGDKVTTFDGATIDLIGSCTFLLTRDFVDGNFSMALQKDGNNKTVTILADGKSIEIFSDGQVSQISSFFLPY